MRSSLYRKHVPMSDSAILAVAPSVFADKPAPGLSDKYAFIPTTQVLTLLREDGWVAVYAAQSAARTPDGKAYVRHVLRFQRADAKALKVGDSIEEIVVGNAHNGTACYRLRGGLYRLICSNGLTISDGLVESIKIRHAGYRDEDVLRAITSIRERMPAVGERVAEMKGTVLTDKEALAFAESAAVLRWDGGKAPVTPAQLLEPRRTDDRAPDLWTRMNVVQENLVIGGQAGRTQQNARGRTRRMTTREVSSVAGNLKINTRLWQLAEETLAAKK